MTSRVALISQEIKRLTGERPVKRGLSWAADTLVVTGLVAAVLGAFHKTWFGGQPVSRLYQLGQRDSLFSQFFTPVREGYDASVYQYFVPNHVWTTQSFAQGQLPAWNPLTGCGAPHIADIETAVFWPLRLLCLQIDPVWSWNLLIVINLAVLAVSTYLLTRVAGAGKIASGLSSLAVAFCPYLVFQSELIGGPCSLIPLVMASFLKAAETDSIFWKITAGAACALMVISGHPEPTFFGILTSCILYAYIVWSGQKNNERTAVRIVRDISVSGAFAVCLSGFVFLPFLELLNNSDCYKHGLTNWDFAVPLNSIFVNLLTPAYGAASPFLGICVPVLALVARLSAWKWSPVVRGMTWTSIIAIIIMAQIPPLNFLSHLPLFSWFVPKYCWPSLLILTSVMAGLGLDQLITRADDKQVRRHLFIALGVVGAALLALKFCPFALQAPRIDEAFVQLVIKDKVWLKDLCVLGGLAVSLLLLLRLPKFRAIAIGAAVAVASIVSLLPITKQATPPTPAFNYTDVQPANFLAERGERSITIGRHTFCPDTNLVYGIANMVPVNVYHPKRFQKFVGEAGITNEGVNQFFDGRVSPLINLASVKYVVSPNPVLSTAERRLGVPVIDDTHQPEWALLDEGETAVVDPTTPPSPNQEEPAVTLTGCALRYYPHNAEVIGRFRFTCPAAASKSVGVQPVLLDDKNNIIWFGDIERLEYQFAPASGDAKALKTIDKDICTSVPYTLEPGTTMTMALQLFNYDKNKYMTVCPASYKDADKQSLSKMATFTREGNSISGLAPFILGHPDERPFRLLVETPGKSRIYENTAALPPAYVVHSVVPVESAEHAIDALSSPIFKDRESAVLECTHPPFHPAPASELAELRAQDQVVLTRPDANTVRIKCNIAREGLLVLTDTYYPGWKAYMSVPGGMKELPIYRANYLFRGVPVTPGEYTIEFRFVPFTMYAGFALAALALAATAWLAFLYSKGITIEEMIQRYKLSRGFLEK